MTTAWKWYHIELAQTLHTELHCKREVITCRPSVLMKRQ